MAAIAMGLLLAACGGGGEPGDGADGRVADARVPLRYEVRGLEGTGAVGEVVVSGGATLSIPLRANGVFGTDTDGEADDPMYPDGLFPADARYTSLVDPVTADPVQVCRTPVGGRSIGEVLPFDCTRTPLRYEVSGLLGTGGKVDVLVRSPAVKTDAVIELPLAGNGAYATDSDTGIDLAAFPGGLFPRDADFTVIANAVTREPAQFCRATPADGSVEQLLKIDCGPRPLVYEVRGLKGSGASISLLATSETAYVTGFDLALGADGVYATDTDDQPGPQTSDLELDLPYPPGLLPQESQYRVMNFVPPQGPPQICTVNGVLVRPGAQLGAPTSIEHPLVIECGSVFKTWRFDTDNTRNLPNPPGADASGEADSIEVARSYTFSDPELSGPAAPLGPFLGRAEQDLFANLLDRSGPNAGMYSSADGRTYWIATEAGNGPGTRALIETRWGVRRVGDDPKFSLTLSALQLAGLMNEGSWYGPRPSMTLVAAMEVRVHSVHTGAGGVDEMSPIPFDHRYDLIQLSGRQVEGGPKQWTVGPVPYVSFGAPIFDADKIVLTTSDGNGTTGNIGHAVLREPTGISVDLSQLAEGDRAVVVVTSLVVARNNFNNESLGVAYLRDPVGFDPGRDDQSVAVTEISGLSMFTPPALPAGFTPQPDLTPAAECAAADAPRAVLQFDAANYAVDEDDPFAHAVRITRSGSTRGEVSARLRLLPGSAQAGADYAAQDTVVRFGDGDAAARHLPLQLVDDGLLEGAETLTVAIDQPGGCADIGPQATALVTVLDDEQPAAASYNLGGTVTGLLGSGLTIETLSEALPITADGAFRFARVFPTGSVYRVRVVNQPQNPRQACTVANGEGTIASADVMNLQIACTTLAEPGGLDPGFGTGGQAWTRLLGAARVQDVRMARQGDGKLLLVSGGPRLLRLQADGTPDTTFGAAGDGTAGVPAGRTDTYQLRSVALQPDGRILVAGAAQIGFSARFDMVVARYLVDGSLDTSFAGGSGVARFDYAQWNDGAAHVLVQADGRILLAGSVSDAGGNGDPSDYAVLRLDTSGQIDTSYGAGGWARLNIAGGYDVPRAAVLTPDGGVVLAGRVARSGGSNADLGLARFTAAGLPDASFGPAGNGIVRPLTPEHDEARDIVVLADGSLLVVGDRAATDTGGPPLLRLERYLADGRPDTSFGNAGVATLPAPMAGFAVAAQADGAVWVAGQVPADGGNADFGIARFTASGQPDTGFGSAGVRTFDLFGGTDSPGAALLQPDGLLVVAGSAQNGSTPGMGLVRVRP